MIFIREFNVSHFCGILVFFKWQGSLEYHEKNPA